MMWSCWIFPTVSSSRSLFIVKVRRLLVIMFSDSARLRGAESGV